VAFGVINTCFGADLDSAKGIDDVRESRKANFNVVINAKLSHFFNYLNK
jgi:hypothetical protein